MELVGIDKDGLRQALSNQGRGSSDELVLEEADLASAGRP